LERIYLKLTSLIDDKEKLQEYLNDEVRYNRSFELCTDSVLYYLCITKNIPLTIL
jgi:hypothetical protein